MSPRSGATASRIQVPLGIDQINRVFHERGWTDGLPIIPPTEELVARMVDASHLPGDEVLGVMPPGNGAVTVEKLAANAVMAGAGPEHMPVVLAAVRAALRPEFNIGGVAATTAGASPLVIVNGPISSLVEINGETACFGSGYRANASIGRSLALVTRNLGSAVPGAMEKSTQAFPGKYTFCTAENEAESPWEPLHVELGFAAQQSAVTLAAVRAFHQITETTVDRGNEILATIAGSMRVWAVVSYYIQARPDQVLLAICPEHAQEIAEAGYTKQQVKDYIYHHARLPKSELTGRSHYGERTWPRWIEEASDDTMVPIVAGPEDIIVIVAGGSGRHSSWLPLWSATLAVTELIAE